MKNKYFIIIFSAIIILSVCFIIFSFYRGSKSKGDKLANITQDGKYVQTIDLSTVKEPYDIRIDSSDSTDNGYNIVHVEKDAISVTEADCPDKICVRQGKLENYNSNPIVCLPHKLVITIITKSDNNNDKTQNDVDAVSGK